MNENNSNTLGFIRFLALFLFVLAISSRIFFLNPNLPELFLHSVAPNVAEWYFHMSERVLR